MHFGQFAFGAANILLNELIQTLQHLIVVEFAVNDIVGVILATCLLECGLGGLFKAEEFEDVVGVGAEVFGDVGEVDDVGFYAVSL